MGTGPFRLQNGRVAAETELQLEMAAPWNEGWRRAFFSLRNRNFAWYFGGNTAFFLAMQMGMVAQGWLVYDLTDKATALAGVFATSSIPIVGFSPFGGVLADRVDKRKLLIFCQALIVLITAGVGVLIATGLITYWHMLGAAFLSGCVWSFVMPARMSYIIELVGQDTIMNAMALSNGAMNATRMAGPALAGVLLGVIGAEGVYFMGATGYAVAVLSLCFLPSAGTMPLRVGQTVWGEILEGLRYIRSNETVWLLLIIGTVPMLLATPYMMMMPVFAEDVWGVGENGLGILMSVPGIGGLVGSLALAYMGDFGQKGKVLLVSAFAFGCALVPFALSPWFYGALPFLVVVGAAMVGYQAINMTLLQTNVDDEVRGRVMSVFMMSFGLMPLGAVPAGLMADVVGAPVAVAAMAALLPVCAVFVGLRYPHFRHLS